jgi:hypothetical protein
MYFITASQSTSIWQVPLIDLLPKFAVKLDGILPGNGTPVEMISREVHAVLMKWGWLRTLSIVESFLYFGSVGLAGNIANA